jgi:hypothetical protein
MRIDGTMGEGDDSGVGGMEGRRSFIISERRLHANVKYNQRVSKRGLGGGRGRHARVLEVMYTLPHLALYPKRPQDAHTFFCLGVHQL